MNNDSEQWKLLLSPSAIGWPTGKEKISICEIVKKGKVLLLRTDLEINRDRESTNM